MDVGDGGREPQPLGALYIATLDLLEYLDVRWRVLMAKYRAFNTLYSPPDVLEASKEEQRGLRELLQPGLHLGISCLFVLLRIVERELEARSLPKCFPPWHRHGQKAPLNLEAVLRRVDGWAARVSRHGRGRTER